MPIGSPKLNKDTFGRPKLDIQQKKFNAARDAYKACVEVGGTPILAFAQGMELYKEVWGRFLPPQSSGICQALVNYWLAAHAAGGTLWSRLFDDSGKFIKQSLVDIAKQHHAFGLPDNTGREVKVLQKLRSEAFLKQHGLLRRRDIASNQLLLTSGAGRADNFDGRKGRGQRMGLCIAHQGMANATNGTYRMISFTKDIGPGHVAAAWVERDVCFFDPNAGEYWFETREMFVKWFGLYVAGNTYNDYFDGVEIRDFAPAAYKGAGGLPRPH